MPLVKKIAAYIPISMSAEECATKTHWSSSVREIPWGVRVITTPAGFQYAIGRKALIANKALNEWAQAMRPGLDGVLRILPSANAPSGMILTAAALHDPDATIDSIKFTLIDTVFDPLDLYTHISLPKHHWANSDKLRFDALTAGIRQTPKTFCPSTPNATPFQITWDVAPRYQLKAEEIVDFVRKAELHAQELHVFGSPTAGYAAYPLPESRLKNSKNTPAVYKLELRRRAICKVVKIGAPKTLFSELSKIKFAGLRCRDPKGREFDVSVYAGSADWIESVEKIKRGDNVVVSYQIESETGLMRPALFAPLN